MDKCKAYYAVAPLGQVDFKLSMCNAELAFGVVAMLSGQKLLSQIVEAAEQDFASFVR